MNRYTIEFNSEDGKAQSCSVEAYSGSGALVAAMDKHKDLKLYPDRITRVIKEKTDGE